MAALMAMLQEQGRQQREEQARRQEELAQRQEELARQQREERARRHEIQILLMKNLQTTIGTQLEEVKVKVKDHETQLFEAEWREMQGGWGS